MATPYTALSGIVKSIFSMGEHLFPSECLHCAKEGPWLCTTCQAECTPITAPTCPFCQKLSPNGTMCPNCRAHYPLTGARSGWYYRGPLTAMIKKPKYQGTFAAYTFFAPDLQTLFATLPRTVQKQAIITSVPSRRETLVRRGFNQSEHLAQQLARLVNRPYQPLIARTSSPTPSQTKLNRKERLANTQAQFRFRGKQELHAPIIIVDDVITTGATLASCASVLRRHGARLIWAITLARD